MIPPLLSFLLLLLVTGSFFFWEGSLVIKLIIKPVRLCPASQPCPPHLHPRWSGEFQPSHGAVVHPATGWDLQAIWLYFSPTLVPALRSTLYSLHPFFLLSLLDNYFLLMLLLRLLLFWKAFQMESLRVTAYLTYQNIFIADHMHFLLILFCIYLDNEQ